MIELFRSNSRFGGRGGFRLLVSERQSAQNARGIFSVFRGENFIRINARVLKNLAIRFRQFSGFLDVSFQNGPGFRVGAGERQSCASSHTLFYILFIVRITFRDGTRFSIGRCVGYLATTACTRIFQLLSTAISIICFVALYVFWRCFLTNFCNNFSFFNAYLFNEAPVVLPLVYRLWRFRGGFFCGMRKEQGGKKKNTRNENGSRSH